jgi:hypothetical protein
MKGKLIKRSNSRFDFYTIEDIKQVNTIASSFDNPNGKLSVKNCEAIANGYDLDKLYLKHYLEVGTPNVSKWSFFEGAKAILEILGDKKFSEGDMMLSWDAGVMSQAICTSNYFGLKRQEQLKEHRDYYKENLKPVSLKQTEWDVEIEMEYYDPIPPTRQTALRPKLDSDGCLILKRV